MAASALVDSSFYIDRLRSGKDPLAELADAADDWEIVTCGVVMTEVLRGLKDRNAHKRMADALSCMIFVPTTNSIWDHVIQLAWELDRGGKVMQVTDLVIAASALKSDAVVLTLDSDFKRVPGLQVATTLL